MIKIILESIYSGAINDEVELKIGSNTSTYIIRKVETWNITSATGADGYSILSIEKK